MATGFLKQTSAKAKTMSEDNRTVEVRVEDLLQAASEIRVALGNMIGRPNVTVKANSVHNAWDGDMRCTAIPVFAVDWMRDGLASVLTKLEAIAQSAEG